MMKCPRAIDPLQRPICKPGTPAQELVKALARLDRHFQYQDGSGGKSPYYRTDSEGIPRFQYLDYDADSLLATRHSVERHRRAKKRKGK